MIITWLNHAQQRRSSSVAGAHKSRGRRSSRSATSFNITLRTRSLTHLPSSQHNIPLIITSSFPHFTINNNFLRTAHSTMSSPNPQPATTDNSATTKSTPTTAPTECTRADPEEIIDHLLWTEGDFEVITADKVRFRVPFYYLFSAR